MPGYTYEASDFSGWIWNRARSVGSLGRAYNYPHQVGRHVHGTVSKLQAPVTTLLSSQAWPAQTIVYWSLYRAARELDIADGSLLAAPAVWYLKQAALTARVRPAYASMPALSAAPHQLLFVTRRPCTSRRCGTHR